MAESAGILRRKEAEQELSQPKLVLERIRTCLFCHGLVGRNDSGTVAFDRSTWVGACGVAPFFRIWSMLEAKNNCKRKLTMTLHI